MIEIKNDFNSFNIYNNDYFKHNKQISNLLYDLLKYNIKGIENEVYTFLNESGYDYTIKNNSINTIIVDGIEVKHLTDLYEYFKESLDNNEYLVIKDLIKDTELLKNIEDIFLFIKRLNDYDNIKKDLVDFTNYYNMIGNKIHLIDKEPELKMFNYEIFESLFKANNKFISFEFFNDFGIFLFMNDLDEKYIYELYVKNVNVNDLPEMNYFKKYNIDLNFFIKIYAILYYNKNILESFIKSNNYNYIDVNVDKKIYKLKIKTYTELNTYQEYYNKNKNYFITNMNLLDLYDLIKYDIIDIYKNYNNITSEIELLNDKESKTVNNINQTLKQLLKMKYTIVDLGTEHMLPYKTVKEKIYRLFDTFEYKKYIIDKVNNSKFEKYHLPYEKDTNIYFLYNKLFRKKWDDEFLGFMNDFDFYDDFDLLKPANDTINELKAIENNSEYAPEDYVKKINLEFLNYNKLDLDNETYFYLLNKSNRKIQAINIKDKINYLTENETQKLGSFINKVRKVCYKYNICEDYNKLLLLLKDNFLSEEGKELLNLIINKVKDEIDTSNVIDLLNKPEKINFEIIFNTLNNELNNKYEIFTNEFSEYFKNNYKSILLNELNIYFKAIKLLKEDLLDDVIDLFYENNIHKFDNLLNNLKLFYDEDIKNKLLNILYYYILTDNNFNDVLKLKLFKENVYREIELNDVYLQNDLINKIRSKDLQSIYFSDDLNEKIEVKLLVNEIDIDLEIENIFNKNANELDETLLSDNDKKALEILKDTDDNGDVILENLKNIIVNYIDDNVETIDEIKLNNFDDIIIKDNLKTIQDFLETNKDKFDESLAQNIDDIVNSDTPRNYEYIKIDNIMTNIKTIINVTEKIAEEDEKEVETKTLLDVIKELYDKLKTFLFSYNRNKYNAILNSFMNKFGSGGKRFEYLTIKSVQDLLDNIDISNKPNASGALGELMQFLRDGIVVSIFMGPFGIAMVLGQAVITVIDLAMKVRLPTLDGISKYCEILHSIEIPPLPSQMGAAINNMIDLLLKKIVQQLNIIKGWVCSIEAVIVMIEGFSSAIEEGLEKLLKSLLFIEELVELVIRYGAEVYDKINEYIEQKLDAQAQIIVNEISKSFQFTKNEILDMKFIIKENLSLIKIPQVPDVLGIGEKIAEVLIEKLLADCKITLNASKEVAIGFGSFGLGLPTFSIC